MRAPLLFVLATAQLCDALSATPIKLHVEFCQQWKYSLKVDRLETMLKDRFGDDIVIIGRNDPETLARLSPSGEWRVGAFEVTRLSDDELLYSKLETKRHLVGTRIKVDGEVVHDDKPFNEWVEKWGF